MSTSRRTQHLLFLDECGTHDMQNVQPDFPVFVLVGLLIGETYYAKTLVPRLKKFKKDHLSNQDVILHSRDIRRMEGAFRILRDSNDRREAFYSDLNELFTGARMRLFAVAIDKRRLRQRFLFPVNPYDVSLSQLLSLVCGPPGLPTVNRPSVARIIAESRGKLEDKQLQREYQSFRRLGLWNYHAPDVQQRRASTVQKVFPDRIDFVRKSVGVGGLELADLAAYPIARAVVNENWDNPSAQVVLRKLSGWVMFP